MLLALCLLIAISAPVQAFTTTEDSRIDKIVPDVPIEQVQQDMIMVIKGAEDARTVDDPVPLLHNVVVVTLLNDIAEEKLGTKRSGTMMTVLEDPGEGTNGVITNSIARQETMQSDKQRDRGLEIFPNAATFKNLNGEVSLNQIAAR